MGLTPVLVVADSNVAVDNIGAILAADGVGIVRCGRPTSTLPLTLTLDLTPALAPTLALTLTLTLALALTLTRCAVAGPPPSATTCTRTWPIGWAALPRWRRRRWCWPRARP